MQVVATWTGARADVLRRALRMTNESYAEHLGVAVRTVAYWRQRPETIPQPAIQDTLDAALERASDRAKAQFAALAGEAEHSDQASGDVQPLLVSASVHRPRVRRFRISPGDTESHP